MEPDPDIGNEKEVLMDTIWILIGAVAVWIFLQAWLLPKLGVST
jgi:hypothetical protein